MQLKSFKSFFFMCLPDFFDFFFVFAGFSGHGNSIHNIIPLLKKKGNVHLYPCPWGYNNYADAYFQSSWEDMVLEVTVSSVKSMYVTGKTHSG